jgi:peroxiredoxin
MSAENTDQQQSKRLPGSKPLSESRIERNGLKAGSIAPDFTMPDIHGRSISLGRYRGRRVVLVFSDPHCGPCSQLAPYLARMYRRRGTVTTEIVMVSRGEIEENRRKAEADGFDFPVVVQDRWKLSRQYGIFGTPVAFLIGEDGRTQRAVAIGFEEIRSLFREEFASTAADRIKETVEDISGVLSSPLPRRRAFRIAAMMAAGAFLSAIGVPESVLAACSAGNNVCGSGCCPTVQKCCNGVCCPPGYPLCNFVNGVLTCQQQTLP